MTRPFLTISFSGAGHLLPYHLGAASAILRLSLPKKPKKKQQTSTSTSLPIRAVSGSSAGAIAAAVFARVPHRMDEYACRFLAHGGRAMKHLIDLLEEEDEDESSGHDNGQFLPLVDRGRGYIGPSLHVATTKCCDGTLYLHNFPSKNPSFERTLRSSTSNNSKNEAIVRAIEASCRIPMSFHPFDMFQGPSFFGTKMATYPDSEGIVIEDVAYVDGGIAAPAPPTPFDDLKGAQRIVVSPISGPARNDSVIRISPRDDSWNILPFVRSVAMQGQFRVRPSIQNLASLRVALGNATKEELNSWYDRGVEDDLRLIFLFPEYS